LKKYWPLFVVILVSIWGAFSLASPYSFLMPIVMHYFMGIFFLLFFMFKFMDLNGFAKGFQMYDLLAKKSKGYAYVYPFLELFLATGYLTFYAPFWIYCFTIILMVFSAIGVLIALKQGLDVKCACMGTVLNVPLSTVTLTEDLGMASMAIILILMLL
jgi:hypothetical protein